MVWLCSALFFLMNNAVTGMSSCDKKKAKRQRVEVKKSNFVDLVNDQCSKLLKRYKQINVNCILPLGTMQDVAETSTKSQITEEHAKRHKLFMKLNPTFFCDMIESLSSSQKDWVTKTGFGSILDFNLHSYPKYLSYIVVKNFDCDSCGIMVDNKILQITENDVHRVLGLPIGPKSVPFIKSDSLAREWRKQYSDNKDPFRVAVKDVLSVVKDSTLSDENFKKNFISLMFCFFFQPPSNSFIRQKLLRFCCNLDRCFDYNWCEFVISCLKKTTRFWLQKDETEYYTGPLPLLLVCTSVVKNYVSYRY